MIGLIHDWTDEEGGFGPGMPLCHALICIGADPEPLLPRFLARRGTELETLRHALAVADWVILKDISYSLKGSGGSYGFKRLSVIGAALPSTISKQCVRGFAVDGKSKYGEEFEERGQTGAKP
ncbi:MAG: hypothetical protein GKR94_06535 [Gammaproteobacteria bacterium]|nr:hypothetical protein [Gammaproteobacteria bacterium]